MANRREQEVGDIVDNGNDIIRPVAVMQQQPADQQCEYAAGEEVDNERGQMESERSQHTSDDVTEHRPRAQHSRCAQRMHCFHRYLQRVTNKPCTHIHLL